MSEPIGKAWAPTLGTHLEDDGQEVHGEAVQVHRAARVELLLELFAGFLVGCFPEYPFGGRAFKAQNGEDILHEADVGIANGYLWSEDTLCYQHTKSLRLGRTKKMKRCTWTVPNFACHESPLHTG